MRLSGQKNLDGFDGCQPEDFAHLMHVSNLKFTVFQPAVKCGPVDSDFVGYCFLGGSALHDFPVQLILIDTVHFFTSLPLSKVAKMLLNVSRIPYDAANVKGREDFCRFFYVANLLRAWYTASGRCSDEHGRAYTG